MLVQAIEIIDGVRRLGAEGDISEEQISNLTVGTKLNITRVRPGINMIGATKPIVDSQITVSQYEILKVEEKQTKINVSYIEMEV